MALLLPPAPRRLRGPGASQTCQAAEAGRLAGRSPGICQSSSGPSVQSELWLWVRRGGAGEGHPETPGCVDMQGTWGLAAASCPFQTSEPDRRWVDCIPTAARKETQRNPTTSPPARGKGSRLAVTTLPSCRPLL